MNFYSPTRDLTARQPQIGVGSDTRLKWLCGCKAQKRPGAIVRGGVMVKCAACAARVSA